MSEREWWRVTFTAGALTKVNQARRRFRCDGHIADVEHFIEPGTRYVRTSLPPNHSEINNEGWWHMRFCMACCPAEFTRVTSPVLTDMPEPTGNHCPGCGWSSGGHDPRCPIPPAENGHVDG